MQVIAISYTGFEDVVGDIYIVGTMVDESWFNVFRDYWNKRSLSLRLRRGLLFEKLGDKLMNHTIRRTKNKKLIPELIMDILNSFPKFWKYQIYIESPYENIVELMEEKMPHNLKVMQLNLKDCKFKFTPHKSLTLSWALAEEYKWHQDDINRKVWGDFGENRIEDKKTQEFIKQRKDCPHIKEEYKLEEQDEKA